MTSPYRTLSRCRICDGDLRVFLSLGETPLANAFVRPDRADDPEARFPLETARCSECALVQLTVVVDPEVMFRDYVYASSASAPLLAHFDELAASVAQDFAPPGALVVEIGSNDGILLRSLGSRGVRALGVEPATVIAARANADGLETLNEFFDAEVAARIRDERGPASAVLGNNVLAHIDDLRGVVRSLDSLLADDGVFIAEVPYLADLLAHVEYDTIYHEHLSYFHLAPLQRLFTSAGFELFDVVRQPIHGGSIRIHAARTGRRAPTARLRELLASEQRLATDAPYAEFAAKVTAQRTALVALLGRLKAEGSRLAGYGATAKGNTMLNYCGIDPSVLDYIADTTPYKQGLLTPGTRIPVRSESTIAEARPDAMLLLAWNYADSIVERHRAYLAGGGRFIHPIPLPRFIPA
ncbi:MAG TPA: class I SAM-dependent methyltransferase [Candidatus Saccharimonadales bacterium]|nr:class I SAM-dependent methyltransferase [Candidatus Saccharimonadales bacterium]